MSVNAYFMDRQFASDDELVDALREKFDTSDLEGMLAPPFRILFFKSETQRSYLLATGAALYCVLDNIRRGNNPKCLWRMSKAVVRSVRIEIWPSKSYIAFGDENPRKFTPELFRRAPIEDVIADFLERAFNLQRKAHLRD